MEIENPAENAPQFTPAEVMAKLGELSADEIARLFRDEGVRGRRGAADRCPVACYVTSMSTADVIYVAGDRFLADDDNLSDGNVGRVGESIREFVSRFDDGDFGYLQS